MVEAAVVPDIMVALPGVLGVLIGISGLAPRRFLVGKSLLNQGRSTTEMTTQHSARAYEACIFAGMRVSAISLTVKPVIGGTGCIS